MIERKKKWSSNTICCDLIKKTLKKEKKKKTTDAICCSRSFNTTCEHKKMFINHSHKVLMWYNQLCLYSQMRDDYYSKSTLL